MNPPVPVLDRVEDIDVALTMAASDQRRLNDHDWWITWVDRLLDKRLITTARLRDR